MITRLLRASLAGFGEFLNVMFPEPVSGYEPEDAPGRWGDSIDPGEMVPDVPIFTGGPLTPWSELPGAWLRDMPTDRRGGIRPPGPATSDAGGVSPASPASPTRRGDGPW